jgi:purine-binding chemotaxis protein CheW
MDKAFVGLLVESVESIHSYYTDEVVAVPLLAKARVEMFQGCLSLGNHGDALLLDHTKVLSNEEIADITQGHSQLYRHAEQQAQAARNKASGHRQSYISFKLGHLFGLPIVDVREIIERPDSLLRTPGSPAFVEGLLNLRGELVPVIDARTLYNITSDERRGEEKILILQSDGEKFGLVVDEVESIVTVDNDKKLPLPPLLFRQIEETFGNDIKEAIQVQGETGTSIVILNVHKLTARIKVGTMHTRETVIIETDQPGAQTKTSVRSQRADAPIQPS